jgi:hypothetical protein
MYDGEKITKNVKPLGYVLGDEGSNAVLGKLFLSDCLKEIAPLPLREEFYAKYNLTPEEVMENVYNSPMPNRFLTEMSLFLVDYQFNEYVHDLIYHNFENFFRRNVCQYDYGNFPVRIVGSSAFRFADILKEIATSFGMKIDMIQRNSMKGLVKYHGKNIMLD